MGPSVHRYRVSQKTWEFSDKFKVKCICAIVFLNEINCKHHLISIAVYERRHSKLFAICHVLWDTLYFELKERKKTTIILVFTGYCTMWTSVRFISCPRPIFNQLGQDVQYTCRLCKANRDSAPNECFPISEIYVCANTTQITLG